MVLVIIAERWSVATSYRDLFEKLSERTISMVFAGQNTSTPSMPMANAGLALEVGNNNEPPLHPTFDDLQLEDWLINLEDIDVPDESQWLVQGLIRGFGGQQDENIFGDLEEPIF